MASERDEGGQLILLAGILVLLAFLLYATQSSLLSAIGQEAGREVQDPIVGDYRLARSSLASTLKQELTEGGVVTCPKDLVAYGGRVQGLLSLIGSLEDNRGQLFIGHFLSATVTGAANPKTLTTNVELFFASTSTSLREEIAYVHSCRDS